jgi:hypothetical protein
MKQIVETPTNLNMSVCTERQHYLHSQFSTCSANLVAKLSSTTVMLNKLG